MAKVPVDLDKHKWHPSPLPQLIVLVSTVSPGGRPNIAPKSWVSMVAFDGPIIGLGCSVSHTTYQNAAATREFVINVPGEELVEVIWSLPEQHDEARLRASGLTLAPATVVKAPLVEECVAHFECRLDSVKHYGEEVFIFARVVAASIEVDCCRGLVAERYFGLRPAFFLEERIYATLDTAKRVGGDYPVDHPLFVVEVDAIGEVADADLVQRHAAFLRHLRGERVLAFAGTFGRLAGGLYALSAPSEAAAISVAQRDPLVQSGCGFKVRPWRRTF